MSEFNVVAIGADGEATDPELAQQGGMGWPEDESLGRIFPVDDGVSRRPAGPDEFAMDQHTAATFGFRIGERYKVATPTGTHSFELVGVFYFMEPDFQSPFQLVAWDMDTARDVLHDGGGYDLIDVSLSPGASLEEVTASIERELGPAYVVLSQQEQVEARDQEMSDLLDVFRNALLAFAVIVLVISAFITYNTFTLVTGQRIKEFGLLRVLGADRRQVASTVAFEALVMGALAAVVGLGLGLLVSEAMSGILAAAGSNLPSADLTVGAGPIIAALALGVGLTVIISLLPAMRARRVTPMVALADDANIDPYSQRRSIIIGSVVGAIGLVLLVVGLLSDLSISALVLLLGFGALGVLVGVNICSPAVAGPMSQVLGWPAARLFRLNGRLARLTAVRNPRRTATTASALMIGLAMVSLVTVLGTSFKETLNGQLEDSVRADWMLCAGRCDNQQLAFSSEAGSEIAQVLELESVEVFRFRPNGVRTADGTQHVLSAANLASFSSHVEPNVTSGSVAGAGPGDVMVHVDAAEELGLAVGDEVRLEISGHEEVAFEVVALHTEGSVLGSWVIDLDDWDLYVVGDQDSLVTAVTAAGVQQRGRPGRAGGGSRRVPAGRSARPGRVPRQPVHSGRQPAGRDQRVPDHGAADRGDGLLQHHGPVSVRADPRDRAAAGRRHGQAADPGRHPAGGGHRGRLRRGHRCRDRVGGGVDRGRVPPQQHHLHRGSAGGHRGRVPGRGGGGRPPGLAGAGSPGQPRRSAGGNLLPLAETARRAR